MAPRKKKAGRKTMLDRMVGESAARYDVLATPRRKNFELDQRRIDMLKDALGARTETEAITRAMDLALELTAFARDVRRGSARMFGKGGFVNRFDDESTLDFSGFVAGDDPRPTVRSRRTVRGGE